MNGIEIARDELPEQEARRLDREQKRRIGLALPPQSHLRAAFFNCAFCVSRNPIAIPAEPMSNTGRFISAG